MKKIIYLSIFLNVIACSNENNISQFKYDSPPQGKYIQWFGDNSLANELAMIGMYHFMNAEQEKATAFFEEAVKYDSSMFAPHVCLAEMSVDGSEKQMYHIAEAKKNVADNNETSKMFVSILDLKPDGYWGFFDSSEALPLWEKMHELEPRGNFIQQFYSYNIKDNKKSISTISGFIENAQKEGDRYDHFLNLLAYKYMAEGDIELAKSTFEKYIDVYKNGYNPYDSMGEYYLKQGDSTLAKEYYLKAIEKYPFARNASNVLKSF
ncbi:MAG: tetratricopeptide repeat protein [Flavobacteriaceae bacterium]|tara:strand:+ start:1032 stop:1826 length:795 start_codon:yes stop_codon:yes gene_type:complete